MLFLEIFQKSQENTCARVFSLRKLQSKAYKFIKKETLVQVFSCKFYQISKNTFLHRTLLVAASEHAETCLTNQNFSVRNYFS